MNEYGSSPFGPDAPVRLTGPLCPPGKYGADRSKIRAKMIILVTNPFGFLILIRTKC